MPTRSNNNPPAQPAQQPAPTGQPPNDQPKPTSIRTAAVDRPARLTRRELLRAALAAIPAAVGAAALATDEAQALGPADSPAADHFPAEIISQEIPTPTPRPSGRFQTSARFDGAFAYVSSDTDGDYRPGVVAVHHVLDETMEAVRPARPGDSAAIERLLCVTSILRNDVHFFELAIRGALAGLDDGGELAGAVEHFTTGNRTVWTELIRRAGLRTVEAMDALAAI